jgi:predicted metal-dependent RNase
MNNYRKTVKFVTGTLQEVERQVNNYAEKYNIKTVKPMQISTLNWTAMIIYVPYPDYLKPEPDLFRAYD